MGRRSIRRQNVLDVRSGDRDRRTGGQGEPAFLATESAPIDRPVTMEADATDRDPVGRLERTGAGGGDRATSRGGARAREEVVVACSCRWRRSPRVCYRNRRTAIAAAGRIASASRNDPAFSNEASSRRSGRRFIAGTHVGRQPAGDVGQRRIEDDLIELQATHDVNVWMSRVRPASRRPCLYRTTEVFVAIQSAASIEGQAGSHTVRLQIDDDQEVAQQWTDSVTGQELFAPNSVAVARRLATAERLRFSFTPYMRSR